MKKTIITLIVLLVVIFGIYYVSNNNSNNTYSPTTSNESPINTLPVSNNTEINATTSESEPKTSTTKEVAVAINNFAFNPSTLTVKAGTKVTWTNNDSAPHTITSDTGNLLNSKNLSNGQSFSFTFNDIGSINYHCKVHPMMKGTVIVIK